MKKNKMAWLYSTSYFSNFNEDIVYSIKEIIVPYLVQFEYYSDYIHYNRVIRILIDSGYDYKDIYYSMAIYLINENIFPDFENNMDIIRTILSDSMQDHDQEMNPLIRHQNIMKMHVIKKVLFSDLKTDETVCSICLDDFSQNSRLKKIECSHFFHTNCLDRWLLEHNKCPMCRHEI